MEGHSPHSGSHYYTATPHPPSSATATATAAAAFFNKVSANHGHLGVPLYAPRAEHFSEMFRTFRSGLASSIPVLDLPQNDDSVAAFDSVGCSGLVYSEIFGGFDFADFAVSYDELFRQSNGSQHSQSSDRDDAWTEVGAETLQEESDASACSGRNQYFLNGDFHQTTDSKFNVCYHKADKGTAEDSKPIHVAELGDVPGNSYLYDYDGSNLLKEDEEIYSYGVVDDIILHVDSSGSISVETQSETSSNPSIPSYGDDRKAGRSHGINLSSTGISVSDVCSTGEPSYSPPSSRQPTIVVETKIDPVGSMSDIERPKGNDSKALFNIGSLDFLNLELDTGSSAIASAEAIQEAMDWAKLKLKSARESMERKKDDAKGTRPVMNNDMNGDGKMRMVFEESISRKDELQGKQGSGYNLFKKSGEGMQDISEASQVLPDTLQAEISLNGAAKLPDRKIIKSQNSSGYPKVDEESRKRETAVCEKDGNAKQLNEVGTRVVSAHNLVTKSLKLEKTNTNRIEDEVEGSENEMEKPTKATKSENLQTMDKEDLHAELKSTEEDTYEERHLISESEYSTSSNNKVPEVACGCEDLKSSNLAAGPDEKNIEPTAVTVEYDVMIKNATAEVGKELKGINGNLVPEDIEEDEKLRREEEFERERLRELELERKRERESELEKERHRKLEEERDKKKEKLHIKRLAELREREREKKLEKDHLRKLEEERQRESEKEMEKERLRAGQAAVEREIVEARQKAMAEARERLEKACANFREKSFSEKSTEARLRAERAAVARAHAEARERAIEKAMAERATYEAREQVERSASEQLSSPFSDIQLRHNSSSSDLWNTDKSDEVKGQSIQRSRSRLERHCRTVERVAKALAEKNMRDLNAQKEQAERNRLAESLDADIKRWSSGKEGNLRALLSTLQYILGQDSGWHPIPLTEIITSSAVKKAYRKATLCVHPDKLQQRGATIQQKYICEKIFDLLKDAWNKFSSEEK